MNNEWVLRILAVNSYRMSRGPAALRLLLHSGRSLLRILSSSYEPRSSSLYSLSSSIILSSLFPLIPSSLLYLSIHHVGLLSYPPHRPALCQRTGQKDPRPGTVIHPSIQSIHTLHILTHSLGRRIRRKALYPRRTPLLCPARPGRTAMEDHPRRDRGAQGQGPEDGSLEHVPPQEPLLPRRRFHQPGVRSDGRVFGQEQAGLRGRFPRFPLIDLSLMNLGDE